MNTNRTVVDLGKVQYADFMWVNDKGQSCPCKPTLPTVFGKEVGDEPAGVLPDFPDESMLQRAKRRKLLDTWTPCVKLKLTANASLTYSGKKAQSIWKEWNRRQFNKKGK